MIDIDDFDVPQEPKYKPVAPPLEMVAELDEWILQEKKRIAKAKRRRVSKKEIEVNGKTVEVSWVETGRRRKVADEVPAKKAKKKKRGRPKKRGRKKKRHKPKTNIVNRRTRVPFSIGAGSPVGRWISRQPLLDFWRHIRTKNFLLAEVRSRPWSEIKAEYKEQVKDLVGEERHKAYRKYRRLWMAKLLDGQTEVKKEFEESYEKNKNLLLDTRQVIQYVKKRLVEKGVRLTKKELYMHLDALTNVFQTEFMVEGGFSVLNFGEFATNYHLIHDHFRRRDYVRANPHICMFPDGSLRKRYRTFKDITGDFIENKMTFEIYQHISTYLTQCLDEDATVFENSKEEILSNLQKKRKPKDEDADDE
jgi:hypothetical protein